MKIDSEHQEHVTFAHYLRLQRIPFIHIPNEGKRSAKTGFHLLQMGLRPGASDFFIARPTSKHHGLFVEMKRNAHYSFSAKKKWINQEMFLHEMIESGYAGSICYGAYAAIRVFELYLDLKTVPFFCQL